MRLTTRGRYAVMAMVDLAKHGEATKPVSLADIASRQEIQLPYLEQIFAQLRKNGLVCSTRGPGGGYRLNRLAKEIPISDIMAAVDEEITIVRCDNKTGAGCMDEKVRCLTHDLWEALGNQIYSYLRSVSLEDVCNRAVNPFGKSQAQRFMVEEFTEEEEYGTRQQA